MASLVISHPKTERQSSNQSRSEAKTFVVYSTIVSHMANQQPQLYSVGGGEAGNRSAWFSRGSQSVTVAICLAEESKKSSTSYATCQ